MATHLAPYLHVPNNQTAEAFAFYASVLGGEPTIMRAGDSPMGAEMDPNLVMHAELHTPDGMHLYGTDMIQDGKQAPVAELAIMTDDAESGRRWYEGLSAGGSIDMALEKQDWGDLYANFEDRFGQAWAINIAGSVA